nr:RNA-directed DNA polymerase, eukaryota, reverse transcriptase zinc-binding domain protein [Tanacetum cinerariifolium]
GVTNVKIKTVNDDVWLQALIDGKKVVVNEASIRHDLKLNDAEVTPLFGTIMVQALEEVGNFTTDVQDIPILDKPSSSQSQRKYKPKRKKIMETDISPTEINTKEHVPIPSNDPLPSGEDRMQLKELMVLCTNLSNKVLDLENEVIEMKSLHKANIEELESRVEKLENENRLLTNELKSFNTMVESPTIKETAMDKEESSKHGRKIADIDADAEVNLENVYDADAEVNLKNVYNLDMPHEETVLSMQDVDSERIEDVYKNVKDVVTTAENVEAKPKAKRVTMQEPSEFKTTLPLQSSLPLQDKDKDKGLMVEPEMPLTRKDQIALNKEVVGGLEAEWNGNMKDNIDWNKVVKHIQSRQSDAMDYFKGISYEQIRPIFEMEYNKVQAYLNKGPEMDAERIKAPRKRTKKEKVEKDQPAKKQKDDELEQDNTKKQKLEEQQEAEELKKNLEIVPDDEDDVFVNVTHLSFKPPTIVDYKIYKEERRSTFKYLEQIIIKDRFKKSQTKEVLDVFLWHTLKVMFEHTVEYNVWKRQKGPQGLARVKNWKLFDSCRVHCVTLETIQLFLLAKKMYPLTNYTLQQMFNEVRLQVDYEVEMAYDLLRLVTSTQEGKRSQDDDKRLYSANDLKNRVGTRRQKELEDKINEMGDVMEDVLEDNSMTMMVLTANVVEEKKQEEVRNVIKDEKLQACAIIETHVKAAKMSDVYSKSYGNAHGKVTNLKEKLKIAQAKVDANPYDVIIKEEEARIPLEYKEQMIKDIDRVLKGFLWCGGELQRGKAKVSWKSVCHPKNQGGLGLKMLGEWNEVLLSKHAWNIVVRKESLWYISKREIYDARLVDNAIVDEIISNGRWKWWPEEWMLKFPLLQQVDVPLMQQYMEDHTMWCSNNGSLRKFSTKQVWKDCIYQLPNVSWSFVVRSVLRRLVIGVVVYFFGKREIKGSLPMRKEEVRFLVLKRSKTIGNRIWLGELVGGKKEMTEMPSRAGRMRYIMGASLENTIRGNFCTIT